MDTLNRIIALGIQAQFRIDNPKPPLLYGVWIPDKGWLCSISNPSRMFGDQRREVAETAAKLYGGGAKVMIIDDAPMGETRGALGQLEPVFREREAMRKRKRFLWLG